jgi:hypothetical protein
VGCIFSKAAFPMGNTLFPNAFRTILAGIQAQINSENNSPPNAQENERDSNMVANVICPEGYDSDIFYSLPESMQQEIHSLMI